MALGLPQSRLCCVEFMGPVPTIGWPMLQKMGRGTDLLLSFQIGVRLSTVSFAIFLNIATLIQYVSICAMVKTRLN